MGRPKLTPEEKAEKEKREEKQRVLDNLQRDLRDHLYEISIGNISEPTIFYKVDDRVIHGRSKKSIITEVIEGGKIYKLHKICTDNNYGKPFDYEIDAYVLWTDILPYKEISPEAEESFTKNETPHLRLNFFSSSVESILLTHYHPGLDLDVKYQRGLVWDREQKIMLIQSIFNNIPIGSVITNRRDYRHNGKLYEVIDGKQRISTLIEFFECRFDYKGKFYRDLSGLDRRHFKEYPLSEAQTQELTEAEKMKIFLKYNTCGKPQDPKHLKKVEMLLMDCQLL